MSAVVSNLVYFAIITKLIVIFIICLSSVFPNHSADAFSPPNEECTSTLDCLFRTVLDGYTKWDAAYFHFIAVNGYMYENTLAFFPLLPIVIRTLANISYTLSPPWGFSSHVVIIGVSFNFICNVLTSVQLYRLSKLIQLSESVSLASSIIFLINPASVFFSTIYSESLYCILLISALVYFHQYAYFRGCFFLFLSVCCRSNGLVNVGFACFYQLLVLSHSIITNHNPTADVAYRLCVVTITIAFVCCPCFLFQFYASFLYCSPTHAAYLSFLLPRTPSDKLLMYARQLNVPTPYSLNSSNTPTWCAGVPFTSYTDLQKKFWNVGFLRYYELKQIPNFLLAIPVLILAILTIHRFYRSAWITFFSFGLKGNRKQQVLLPHIYHLSFLCLYGITNVHIQVLTRMLFSSCPVIYWYCASILVDEESTLFRAPSLCSKNRKKRQLLKGNNWALNPSVSSFFHLISPCTYKYFSRERFLLIYCFSYILVGSVMHANFLPWT